MRRSGVRLPQGGSTRTRRSDRSPVPADRSQCRDRSGPATSGERATASDLTPCSTIQRPSVRLSSTTWPRAYPWCPLRRPVLAWPPRRLHQLPPGDAVLGEPRLGRVQAVQLADPVQRFEGATSRGQSSRSTASRSADPRSSSSASSSSDLSRARALVVGQLDSVPEAATGGQALRIRVCDAVFAGGDNRCPSRN